MRELELKAKQEKTPLAAEIEAKKEAGFGKHPTSELVPEAYRQKFWNYLKYDSKTHVELAREKENLFNRWCHSKEVGPNFKKLKQMVLLEEFKDKVRPDIRSHLDEQKVEELEKAAIIADDYAPTHKMSSKSGKPQ